MIKTFKAYIDGDLIYFDFKLIKSEILNIYIKNYGITDTIINKSKINEYINNNLFRLKLTNFGCYSIIIVTQNNNLFISDKPLLFYDEKIRKRFIQLSKEDNKSIKKLDFLPGNDIFSDWIITNLNLSSININLNKYFFFDRITILTQFSLLNNCDGYLYFSGYQTTKKHSIIYNNTLAQENINEINEFNPGRFSLIKVNTNEHKIFIRNDFFGLEKIFIYKNSNNFIISNRFHLLLKIINLLGIKLNIDIETISSMLSSNIWMFAQNHFTQRTIFKNLKIGSILENYDINSDGTLSICDSKIKREFSNNSIIHSAYEKEKKLNQISCRLRNTSLQTINNNLIKVADITGGADSRLSLSLLPIFDKNISDKILFQTKNIEKTDKEISNKIS